MTAWTPPKNLTSREEFIVYRAEQRRRERDIVRSFAAAVRSNNLVGCTVLFEDLEQFGLWRFIPRAISKFSPSEEFRKLFLAVWLEQGDDIRSSAGDDRALVDVLRILLPTYSGPSRLLFRGEGAWNRKRKTYGLSWSDKEEVARGFAKKWVAMYDGGTVLLKTVAPADAIISAPCLVADRYEEGEFIVDRRRLKKVLVLERFSQVNEQARPLDPC